MGFAPWDEFPLMIGVKNYQKVAGNDGFS